MITFYQIGTNTLWTGATLDIEDGEGAPPGWTSTEPPELNEGEWAQWIGGWQVVDEVPSAPLWQPTSTDVIAERERRLALGFNYDFGDARGVHHIGTTPDDMRKWMDEVTPLAQAYLNLAQPTGEITITTETGPVTVTAVEWQQILLAAAAWRQPIYAASFALQAMDPIPADFADDRRWV